MIPSTSLTPSDLKVVQVASSLRGGAGRAARRLQDGLLEAGVNSHMYVGEGESSANTRVFSPDLRLGPRLRRRLRRAILEFQLRRYAGRRTSGYDPFSSDRSRLGREPLEQLPPCDLVNLHWISGFIDIPTFVEGLSARTPLVCTLHDQNAFTGGCHYDHGCGRFVAGCGKCPLLGSHRADDLSAGVWRRKRRVYRRCQGGSLTFVAPSEWMKREAARTPLTKELDIRVIPYGLDTAKFQPRPRSFCREILGVPPAAKVLLFVAEELRDPRKGLRLLDAALSDASCGEIFVLTVGSTRKMDFLSRHQSLALGHITNDVFLSMIYSAADIFVMPSLEENLGQTGLEAMACGVPVVAFETGGNPDFVKHGDTGFLVPLEDARALRDACLDLLGSSAKREKMSASARKLVESSFTLPLQAHRYVALYQELLAGQRAA